MLSDVQINFVRYFENLFTHFKSMCSSPYTWFQLFTDFGSLTFNKNSKLNLCYAHYASISVPCCSNTTSLAAQPLYTQLRLSGQVSWYVHFRNVPTGGSTCRSPKDSRSTVLPVSLYNCQTSDAMCKELAIWFWNESLYGWRWITT
jgi:hypothetical protein